VRDLAHAALHVLRRTLAHGREHVTLLQKLRGGVVFDGIGELHFRTAAGVFTGMYDTEEGLRLIMEDTERFMDHDTSTTVPTNEYVIPAP